MTAATWNAHDALEPEGPSQAEVTLAQVWGYYEHTATNFEVDLWRVVIQQYGDEAVIRFLRAYVLEKRKFQRHPRIEDAMAVLDPAAHGADAAFLSAVAAVARIGPYSSPTFDDSAVAGAIAKMGGWKDFCEKLPDAASRFDYDAFAKRFGVAYEIAKADLVMQRQAPIQLLGMHAISRQPVGVLSIAARSAALAHSNTAASAGAAPEGEVERPEAIAREVSR